MLSAPRESRNNLRFKLLRAFASLLIVLLVAACEEPASGNSQNIEPPIQLPEYLALTRLGGTPERLNRYRGKTVILNVWATWCAPCRYEMPSLQKLSEKIDPENFVVTGVSVDKDWRLVREFLLDKGYSFSRYIDAQQKVTKAVLGVKVLPETIIIDPRGRVVKRIVGAIDWDGEKAMEMLESVGAMEARNVVRLVK